LVIILPVDAGAPDPQVVRRAVDIVKAGGVLVYPTDTVYGLGTNALDHEAIVRVFEAKRRPLGQPMPVAIDGVQMAERIANVTPAARRLMDIFWPGGLTIVLPGKAEVPDLVTGGSGKVALRVPKHRVPILIIHASGLPLIATSANVHGQPSCLTAKDAQAQLGESVDLILDGGPAHGFASTVLDMTVLPPRIIREGQVSRLDLARVLTLEIN